MSVLRTKRNDNGRRSRMPSDSHHWRAYTSDESLACPLHPAHPRQFARLTSLRLRRHFALIATLAVWPLLLPDVGIAAWKTGDEFQQRLRQRVTISWDHTPLRDGLMRLADAQSIAIFLDRRADPQAQVSIELDNVVLEDAIRQVARQRQLAVGYVGSVVYVGPPTAAVRVATLAAMREEDGKHLEEKLRMRLEKLETMRWPRLSEPRWIVRKLCAEADVSLADPDAIPHDLWPAYDFPEMTVYERLTLVLANFGYTFQIDDQQTLKLMSMPRAVAVERVYGSKNLAADIPKLEKQFPQAIIRTQGRKIVVLSTMEDQWAIARELGAGQSAPEPTPLASQRFTLTVKDQPMGWLCEQVAKRVGMTVDFSDEATQALEQRVSFKVDKVTLQELFESIVQPAGLHVTLEQGVVHVQ